MISELRPELHEASSAKGQQRLRGWKEFGVAAPSKQERNSLGAKRTGGTKRILDFKIGFYPQCKGEETKPTSDMI